MGIFDAIDNKVRLVSDLGEDVVNRLFTGLDNSLLYSIFPGEFSL